MIECPSQWMPLLFVCWHRTQEASRFSSLLHCALALLCCCSIVLLNCCTVVLLHCCTIVLLYYCTVALLYSHYAAEAETLNGTCLQNDATWWSIYNVLFNSVQLAATQLVHTIALIALDVCGGEMWCGAMQCGAAMHSRVVEREGSRLLVAAPPRSLPERDQN